MTEKKKEKKCPKTMTGKHIWVKNQLSPEVALSMCAACGLVDDREFATKQTVN